MKKGLIIGGFLFLTLALTAAPLVSAAKTASTMPPEPVGIQMNLMN